MKTQRLLGGLALIGAAIAMAAPASAQLTANALPGGELLPGSWTAAAPIFPTPGKWNAQVSWAITNPSAGVFTYWYKVDHLGGGPLSPPVQNLKSFTLDLDPSFVQQIASVYQFGQYEAAPMLSVAAEPVLPGDLTLRWSHTVVSGLDQLAAGETIYFWLRSTDPNVTWVNFTLQDGTVAQTLVPAPAPIPEPMSMALVGLGLGAVASLRKKSQS